MDTDKIVAALAQATAFVGLSADQIAEIARQSKRMKFVRDDIITRAGQAGDGAILVVSGSADRMIGQGAGAKREPIEPGSMIGEMAMLIEHDYGSTVIARDWVYCLKITRAAMHDQMRGDRSLTEHFERRVTERLQGIKEQLRQMEAAISAAADTATAGAAPRVA